MIYLLIFITSALVSGFGSLIGFGGGVFLVPVLVLFFKYSLFNAVGAAIVSLVPASLINTYFNHNHGNVDYKTGLIFEIPTALGVSAGSFFLAWLPVIKVKIFFIALLVLVALSFRKKENLGEESKLSLWLNQINHLKPTVLIHNPIYKISYSVNLILVTILGFASGTLAGLFGIGGGFVKTPIMIKVFRVPAKIAAGTALFMILITSSIGSISHILLGHVSWPKALPVMIGFSVGALAAKPINKKISHSKVEKLVGISLLFAALMMAVGIINN